MRRLALVGLGLLDLVASKVLTEVLLRLPWGDVDQQTAWRQGYIEGVRDRRERTSPGVPTR